MMLRIAYLTGRTYAGKSTPAGETPAFETRDFDLLRQAATLRGMMLEPAFWDDAGLPEQGFDGALVRSCWDYTHRPDAFLDQLAAFENAGLPVFNSSHVLRWNARKSYLAELQKAGSPVIDTIWLERADGRSVARAFEDLDAAELVLKPQVGASSQETLRLKRNSWSDADLALGPRGAAMLQPFLPAIETEGELSLIFFGGAFSHAVFKRPEQGRWLANDHARFEAAAPPAEAFATAEVCLRAAPGPLIYARVDLLAAAPGDWRLIELELIEPHLFLALAPNSADFLARALADALGGGVLSG
jgi:glutathione synthase/RimK-type ligase-like ATP-grasp enzyme